MMGRRFITILFSVLFLFVATTVNASITGITCADDGDGAIVMGPVTWGLAQDGEYDLTMTCAQSWGPGHVGGDITAPDDPTLRITQIIDNDTTFDWTDYHITFGMAHTYTLSTPVMPTDWYADISSTVYAMMPNGNMGYVTQIDYFMGSGLPVLMGDDGTFGFKVVFNGSTAYCTEQWPTPEPTTILLLGLGAMSVIRRRR
jgi:hypothetical protein